MEKRNALVFSIIIILGALVVATGIITLHTINNGEIVNTDNTSEIKIRPVTDSDHILGNPNADIILIEYSDLDCPYCREFHKNMERIMNDYGKKGQIAWVYRHFPLKSLIGGVENITEDKPSIAAECVADLAGNDKFFEFISIIMSDAPLPVSDEFLKENAVNLGVDEEDYSFCISSGKFNTEIERDIQDGLAIYEFDSDFGTPYNIIVTKTGIQKEIPGLQPYSVLKEIVENFSFPAKL